MIARLVIFSSSLKHFLSGLSPFTKACASSVFLHIFLFFLLGIFSNIFRSEHFYHNPLVFDFVFIPSEFDDTSVEAANPVPKVAEEKAAKPAEPRPGERRNIPKTEEPEDQPNKTLAEAVQKIEWVNRDLPNTDATTTTKLTEEPESPPVSSPQPETPKNPQEQPQGPYFVDAPTTTDLIRPLYDHPDPNIIPVKVAISKKQQEMLEKRFRKWTEDFHKMDLADSTLAWEEKGRQYVARFRQVQAQTSTDIEEVLVEINTEKDGMAFTTEMRMRRLAFSSFAQFVDYWDPRVAVHDDELEGRFHANSKINIMESLGTKPRFYGKVTTASYDVNTGSSWPFFNGDSIFLAGLETGVKAISLPKNFTPFLTDLALSEQVTHQFGDGDDAKVTFYSDGTFGWRYLKSSQPEQRRRLPDEPFYIVGSKKKKLHLLGKLKGKVLVYSPGKIVIDGNLTYARHPDISNVADDYLGIVSEKDVEIANSNVTGPGDLHVHASIYAKKRFSVPDLSGEGRATLFIYGSLAAGTLSATEPRYATHVRFDKRLESSRPPSFPMTNRYEVSEWDSQWKMKPKAN